MLFKPYLLFSMNKQTCQERPLKTGAFDPYQLFGDNTYADAYLSRMTSKAYRLDFPGRDRRVESK